MATCTPLPPLRPADVAALKRAKRVLDAAIAQIDDALARPFNDPDRELRVDLAINRTRAATSLLRSVT